MPDRCVAYGCSNTTSDKISLYRFPGDPTLKAQWEKQVQTTRARWNASGTSVLCSEHFSVESFRENCALAASFGIKMRRMLKPGSIPSIFPRPQDKSTFSTRRKKTRGKKTGGHKRGIKQLAQRRCAKKERSAAQKRERVNRVKLYIHAVCNITLYISIIII